MVDISDGVLVGQGSTMQFDANTLMFFSVGEMFTAKLIMAIANCKRVVELGGMCRLMFDFSAGDIAGTIRYARKVGLIEQVFTFKDIYELMTITTTIGGEVLPDAE